MRVPRVIRDLLGSKKFVTALVATAAVVALRFGVEIDVDECVGVVSPLLAYILGQGLADIKRPAPEKPLGSSLAQR